MRVGFRVDGSKKIGLGHTYRSISLAKEFKKNKIKSIFLTTNFFDNYDDIIRKNGFIINKINKKPVTETYFRKKLIEIDAKKVVNIIKKNKLDIIFLDNNFLNVKWEKIVSKYCKIVLINDQLNRKTLCDFLISYHLSNKPHKFRKYLLNKECKILSDSQYTIIKKSTVNRSNILKNKKILIYMGGADKNNIAVQLKKIFEKKVFKNFMFSILLSNKPQMRLLKKYPLNRNFKIIDNKRQSLYGISKSFNLIILGFGTSVYELSNFGKKMLIIIQNKISNNIYNNIKEFNLFNFCKSIKKIDLNMLKKSLFESKIKINERIQIYDGYGSSRIVQYFKKDFYKIKLEEAKLNDKYFLFNLMNDPTLRKSSVKDNFAKYSNFIKWLKKIIEKRKKNNQLFILRSRNLKIGQIKLEKKKEKFELDCLISNEFKGNSFERKIIKLVIKKLKNKSTIFSPNFIFNYHLTN